MKLKPDTLALTVLLGLLTALGPLSTDMYLPSLPDMTVALATTPAAVQATLSAFLFGFAAGQIVYGPLSDRYGRRPVLLSGLVLYTAASVVCIFAPTIEVLTAARVVQALGAAGPIVLARAVVRDLYAAERAGQELARMGTIMGLVPLVAPLFGGILHDAFGWRAAFVAITGFGVLATCVVTAALPETAPRTHRPSLTPIGLMRNFAPLFSSRAYLAYVGLACCTYGGLFAFISASSFVLQGIYGLSPLSYGFAFGVVVIGYIAGTMLGRRLTRRIGIDRTVGVGVMFLAIGGLAIILATETGVGETRSDVWRVILPMIVYLVGVGVALPQALAGALTPFPERAGTASSFLGLAQMAFAAFLGLGVGHMLGAGIRPLTFTVAVMGLSALALFVASAGTRQAARSALDTVEPAKVD